MRVVDHKEGQWFLYEDDQKLFIEANCNHSFLGYIYTIELNKEELEIYKQRGYEYLSALASDIHNVCTNCEKQQVQIYRQRRYRYVFRTNFKSS